jgi:hypothetical protein
MIAIALGLLVNNEAISRPIIEFFNNPRIDFDADAVLPASKRMER